MGGGERNVDDAGNAVAAGNAAGRAGVGDHAEWRGVEFLADEPRGYFGPHHLRDGSLRKHEAYTMQIVLKDANGTALTRRTR